MNSPTLLASFCRTEVVSCILDQELSMSAISSAKSKLHKCTSPVHVMPPALLSVLLLSTQSVVIANSSGGRLQPCRAPVITWNQLLMSPLTLTALLLSSSRSASCSFVSCRCDFRCLILFLSSITFHVSWLIHRSSCTSSVANHLFSRLDYSVPEVAPRPLDTVSCFKNSKSFNLAGFCLRV